MRIIKVLLLAALLAVLGCVALYLISPSNFVRLAVASERWAAGLQHHEIDIPGFRVHYLDSGGSGLPSGGQGPPLLLVHGFGGDKDNWTRVARHLRKRYRVIAVDLPGFGESDAPRDVPYRIADQVERLHAFTQALGLSRVHLGGNSMGGNVVGTYAAKYPNEVGSLWLIACSGVSRAPQSELRQFIADTGTNPLAPGTPEQYRTMLGWVMARPPFIPGAVLDTLSARAVAARTLRDRQYADLVDEANGIDRLMVNLPIQTHVLWGEQDRVLNVRAVDVLMAILPLSSRTIMPGIGHLPMLEAPALTAEDYFAFRKASRTG